MTHWSMIKRKEKFYLVLPSGSKFNIYGKHTMILGLRYGETKNRIGAQNVYVLTHFHITTLVFRLGVKKSLSQEKRLKRVLMKTKEMRITK